MELHDTEEEVVEPPRSAGTPWEGRGMEAAVYRKALLMVGELHVRGYQRLRIAPGMSASGCYWRCSVTPAAHIRSRNSPDGLR
jgi:hypothetical protein